MSRLSPMIVEEKVTEMWDALAGCPRDEAYEKACADARRIERELRSKLHRQEKIDRNAEELYDALRLLLDYGTRTVNEDDKPIGVQIEGCHVASERFERAWRGAIEVLKQIDGP